MCQCKGQVGIGCTGVPCLAAAKEIRIWKYWVKVSKNERNTRLVALDKVSWKTSTRVCMAAKEAFGYSGKRVSFCKQERGIGGFAGDGLAQPITGICIVTGSHATKASVSPPTSPMQPTRQAGFLSQGLVSREGISRAADWERYIAEIFSEVSVMASIHDGLKSLLEDYSDFDLGDPDEWDQWGIDVPKFDKLYYEYTSQWIKSVEAILELYGKDKELKIWRNATSVGQSQEEHRLVLRQIISKLDNESLPKPHEDMPESVKVDYEEARYVFQYSARSAAALLRLAIQNLCKELGEKGKNLNTDIKNLVARGLPVHIQQALDIVRVVGNECVHPGVINVRDDPEIAMDLFGLVNDIVEDRIGSESKKIRIQEKYNSLPESKREQIEKRDKDNKL